MASTTRMFVITDVVTCRVYYAFWFIMFVHGAKRCPSLPIPILRRVEWQCYKTLQSTLHNMIHCVGEEKYVMIATQSVRIHLSCIFPREQMFCYNAAFK